MRVRLGASGSGVGGAGTRLPVQRAGVKKDCDVDFQMGPDGSKMALSPSPPQSSYHLQSTPLSVIHSLEISRIHSQPGD